MNRVVYVKIAGKSYPMCFSLGVSKKIVQKFGSLSALQAAMKKKGGDESKNIDTVLSLLSMLIAQGCAYKNYFEKDLPVPEDAPIIDGKWTPLPEEVLEIAIGIQDMEEVAKRIEECLDVGTKKEVKAVSTSKNAKTTQGV